MPSEPVRLHTRDKRVVDATADVQRYNPTAQAIKAMVAGFGGLLLGAVSIVIPLWHFFGTWALPLGGLITAVYFANGKANILRVNGTCPLCEKPLAADGGPYEDPMWVRCQACGGALRVELGPDPRKA